MWWRCLWPCCSCCCCCCCCSCCCCFCCCSSQWISVELWTWTTFSVSSADGYFVRIRVLWSKVGTWKLTANIIVHQCPLLYSFLPTAAHDPNRFQAYELTVTSAMSFCRQHLQVMIQVLQEWCVLRPAACEAEENGVCQVILCNKCVAPRILTPL